MDFILSLLKFMGFLLVFGSILFLIMITTRFIGNKAKVAMRGKHISVIETVSLGFDKQLHLIRVSDQYLLISSCGKNLTFMTNIKGDIPEEPMQESATGTTFDFKEFFEKYLSNITAKRERKVVENQEETGKAQKYEPEEKDTQVFKTNLGRLKNITRRVDTNEKTGGDDL